MSPQSLNIATVNAFFPNWVRLLDEVAPIDAFLNYFVDGEFEHWRYPGAQIRNVEELQSFFAKTWGGVVKNRSAITNMKITPLDNDKYEIVADVDWIGFLADGETQERPLRYTMTIGSGSSKHDPAGDYPKVYRYQMDRV